MPRYAAVDIGSNSVRMQAAEVVAGSPVEVLAADREVTRLGASVFSAGRISEDAMNLVCEVLKRFAATYNNLDVMGVRAVATSAVRDASNQAEFTQRASEALGSPVEIISGPEEARLIHLGVQSLWPHPKQRVLVIDVGGGSAEFIVAEKGELKEGLSRPLGAVRLTEVFLKNDPPTETEIGRLQRFIDDKFEPALRRIGDFEFDRVIATSATAAAVVSAVNRVGRSDREAADRLRARTPQVKSLLHDLSTKDLNARKKLPGVGPRRAEIIVAGTAVFARALELLRLPSMYYSVAGVRDGIIADLAARGVGRELSRLTRQQLRVAEVMCKRYSVDMRSAQQIAHLSTEIFDSFRPLHKLPAESGKLLEAAAYLHNVGHYISDTGHHKHSAYIVMNSDMPGYTDQERMLIALLCRYHRKSMPTARHDPYKSLSADTKRVVNLLTPLLRIGVGLDATKQQRVSAVECQLGSNGPTVTVRGSRDVDLELWAAERAAETFRTVYETPLSIVKARKA
jgi:exopolyphosphatase / guanosine-5'-triphosphate,3'-diphosphate pyrophosphatase